MVRTLLEIHLCFSVLAKKIVDFLVVDFNETATDKMSFGRIVVCYGNNLLESSGDDSLGLLAIVASHHCMGLSTSCLPIGEDGAIVAFKDIVDQGKGTLLVDEGLGAVGGENIIERKCFRLLFGILFKEVNGVVFGVDFDYTDAASIFLVVVHGTASYHHLHALRHLIELLYRK